MFIADLNARFMALTGGGDHEVLREKVREELAVLRQKGFM